MNSHQPQRRDQAYSPEWLSDGQESRLDCETAMQLRCYLGPILNSAESWPNLIAALRDKGFDLAFSDARLVLRDHLSGNCICTSRFLGAPLHKLVARMGRPSVRVTGGETGMISLPA